MLAVVWALSKVWEAQHWYEIAVAWQDGYWRDLGTAQQRDLQLPARFLFLPASEFREVDGDCSLDQINFAATLVVPTRLRVHAEEASDQPGLRENSSDNPAISAVKSQQAYLAWSRQPLSKIDPDLLPQERHFSLEGSKLPLFPQARARERAQTY
jgi:hypothetical protein